MAKCFRCLDGDYLEQLDEYDGDVLQCLACGHKVNLDGSSLIRYEKPVHSRTPVYKKRTRVSIS